MLLTPRNQSTSWEVKGVYEPHPPPHSVTMHIPYTCIYQLRLPPRKSYETGLLRVLYLLPGSLHRKHLIWMLAYQWLLPQPAVSIYPGIILDHWKELADSLAARTPVYRISSSTTANIHEATGSWGYGYYCSIKQSFRWWTSWSERYWNSVWRSMIRNTGTSKSVLPSGYRQQKQQQQPQGEEEEE